MINLQKNKKEVSSDTKVDSFSVYPSSDSDEFVDNEGEKYIKDFHMYKEGDNEEDGYIEDSDDEDLDEEDEDDE